MKSNVKNSIDSAIGKVFKSYRKKYHLTQTQVADKLGISEKYISRLENGNSGVKPVSYTHLTLPTNSRV